MLSTDVLGQEKINILSNQSGRSVLTFLFLEKVSVDGKNRNPANEVVSPEDGC